jgi:hypothetical protein
VIAFSTDAALVESAVAIWGRVNRAFAPRARTRLRVADFSCVPTWLGMVYARVRYRRLPFTVTEVVDPFLQMIFLLETRSPSPEL